MRRAVSLAPLRAAIRKDLAYALLKTGENEAARDEFEAAMRIDGSDWHAAMEYAYLAYETQRQREARRVFDRLRRKGHAAAADAFRRVDDPLAAGISRWKAITAGDPANFSAHQELARLAELRDDAELAAVHYEAAWRLRPAQRHLLVSLGGMWREAGQEDRAIAAWLAASRGAEPRAAGEARRLLPTRYPYVYEFRQALELDPDNAQLRRELAFLLLEMGVRAEAEREFEHLAPADEIAAAQLSALRGQPPPPPSLKRRPSGGTNGFPGPEPGPVPGLAVGPSGSAPSGPLPPSDAASRAGAASRLRHPEGANAPLPQPPSPAPANGAGLDARALGLKSFQAGYFRDAVRYLGAALEDEPLDFPAMLKLGWAHNMLRQDSEAVRWFGLARKSPVPAEAAEARRAWRNLSAGARRVRTTVWMLPMYSSRWNAAFGYGHLKVELRLGSLPLRPYAGVRLAGDSRGAIGGRPSALPQYLSETALIPGAGIATSTWRGLTGWVEAGVAVSYLDRGDHASRHRPDYRGGLSLARGWGALAGAEANGAFFEHNLDAVYVHRFDRTLVASARNRAGYTWRLGGTQVQPGWNFNANADPKRQYWANFLETGPGVRIRPGSLPALTLTFDALRGAHTVNSGNPRRPNFNDVRLGLWYAFTY